MKVISPKRKTKEKSIVDQFRRNHKIAKLTYLVDEQVLSRIFHPLNLNWNLILVASLITRRFCTRFFIARRQSCIQTTRKCLLVLSNIVTVSRSLQYTFRRIIRRGELYVLVRRSRRVKVYSSIWTHIASDKETRYIRIYIYIYIYSCNHEIKEYS